MAIETPKFEILQKDGKFEIRAYQEYINASVEIESDYQHALGEGFRILADYIFGNNRAKKNIAMTAPVTEQASKKSKNSDDGPGYRSQNRGEQKVSSIIYHAFQVHTGEFAGAGQQVDIK